MVIEYAGSVIENLNMEFDSNYEFVIICLREDYDKYDFKTTPNLEQVAHEIENFEHFHINKSTSEISDDYFKTLRYGLGSVSA